jgi:two-component system cell cycle sensor histidine kinase/response regulator CckA
MPDGGQVKLTTRLQTLPETVLARDGYALPAGTYGTVTVADTGSGVAETHRDDIFEPFFTTKAPGLGTGLGLSSARGMVRRCGGDIQFESAAGRGSVFSVLLPIHERLAGDDER